MNEKVIIALVHAQDKMIKKQDKKISKLKAQLAHEVEINAHNQRFIDQEMNPHKQNNDAQAVLNFPNIGILSKNQLDHIRHKLGLSLMGSDEPQQSNDVDDARFNAIYGATDILAAEIEAWWKPNGAVFPIESVRGQLKYILSESNQKGHLDE